MDLYLIYLKYTFKILKYKNMIIYLEIHIYVYV